MRTLRWGMAGDDVARLQQALQSLGYYAGAVDGRFGVQTRSAVMAFQRARGLPVDGVAGPVTLGALGGCENDARTMSTIASAEGFTPAHLLTRDATTENVLGAIADAARRLEPGDFFLLTYAGHGGQVPNRGADPEEDQQDETWVLWDRMLLDDELHAAFGAFDAGVNLVLLSDSCHSGTVYRARGLGEQEQYADLKASFYADLAVGRDPADPLAAVPRPAVQARAVSQSRSASVPAPVRYPRPSQRGVAVVERVAALPKLAGANGDRDGAARNGHEGSVLTRELPLAVNDRVVQQQADRYEEIKAAVRGADIVAANCVAISGCQDNQLSQEVNGAGVFTTTLARTWANNSFAGTYQDLHRAIVAQMGSNQTPQLGRFGGDPDSLLMQTPFNP